MTTCSICCEKFTNTTRAKINCTLCKSDEETIVCLSCTKQYIHDNNNILPKCMVCNNTWDDHFLQSIFSPTFINKDIKLIKQNFLYEQNVAKLPETQPYANRLLQVNKLDAEQSLIDIELMKLNNQIKLLKNKQQTIRANIGNLLYGGDHKVATETAEFICKCPLDDCNGFLNSKYICGLCDSTICKDCMEILTPEHVCDEEKKSTISFIKKDTKPCPTCGNRIHKIDGCDQMWCISCKTAFSWKSGLKIIGQIHNPEYFRWLRDSGQTIERNPNDPVFDPCREQLPPPRTLLSKLRWLFPKQYINPATNTISLPPPHPFITANNLQVRPESDLPIVLHIHNMLRLITHIEHHIEPHNRRVNERKEIAFRDCRASFLLKKYNINQFKSKLHSIDKESIKLQTYTNIWNLLKFQLIESIREIMFIHEGTGPVESHKVQVIQIYNTMQDFKTYINKQFSHYGKIFKNNSPSITHNWEPKDV